MIVLALFFLFRSNVATIDEESMASLARSLVSSDLFLSHLRSSLVNTSINPCHNFFRRVCSVDTPDQEAFRNKMTQQINIIMNNSDIREICKPSLNGLLLEKLRASADSDHTNYTDNAELLLVISKIDSAILVELAKFVFTDIWFYSPIFTEWMLPDRKGMARLLDRTVYKLLDAKIKANETTTLNYLIAITAQGLTHFMKIYAASTDELMLSRNDMVKMHMRFEKIMRDEPIMMRLMQSLGSNHSLAVERVEAVIKDVIDECRISHMNASWSNNEDRFGYSRAHVYTTYLKNLSFAIFYTNRYSISTEKKTSLLLRFENLFVEKFNQLTAISHMTRLRLLIARNWAVDQIEQENFGTMIPMKSTTNHLTAFALYKSDYAPSFVLMNPLCTMPPSHSSAISTLIGFTGFTFAHEIYHQTQFVMRNLIEDDSELQNGVKCVESYMNAVCDRFTEVACSSHFTELEDTADIFGSQIAYRVLQKQLGDILDKIADADLQLTHRELFFHTIAIANCDADKYTQWLHEYKDIHSGELYRTNSILSHLSTFKETYGCYEDDLMSIPEKLQCPLFSQYFA